ncbi:leucine-rich repeat-containing protein 40-like [Bacillus rossius redtenbacheri]|uniref:leucine-rich repeat-containing protein 40-like n=1 Tax=Bacillus rossius redtenbacheri TaxID=93214 RepID=UPI002FDDA754
MQDNKKQNTRAVNSRLRRINPVFHTQTEDADSKVLSQHMIKQARKSGTLNLSGRGLGSVPAKVWRLNDLDEAEAKTLEVSLDREPDDKWWENVPLASLDLSSNALASLPAAVKKLDSLVALNVQDNSLEALPRELGCLSGLQRLNASRNRLATVPPALYCLQELRQLSLAHNRLSELAEELGDLIMLEQLDLSHNCLATIPAGTGFLTRLTKINLSHNQLVDIPPDLMNLRVLRELDLGHNELAALPPLGELRRLEVLLLQGNRLPAAPELQGCACLRELHLQGNRIVVLEAETLESVRQLKVLSLADNELASLPEEVFLLQHLVRLDLSNNALATLPRCLGFLPHLQSLRVEGNPLRAVRSDVVQCGTARLMRFLRETAAGPGDCLGVAGEGWPSDSPAFPDRYTMRTCQALSLAARELSAVPESVFQEALEAGVKLVDLSKNCLHQVPPGLALLGPQLVELNLGCNALTAVPRELARCCSLQYLNLERNQLSSLPEELGSLDRLRELALSYNKLREIPACVFGLQGLEILVVRGNQLTAIDVAGLARLPRLAALDLADNNIALVPPELGNLDRLRSLDLVGNCFRQPRHAILEKGTPFVLSYLRDRIPRPGSGPARPADSRFR